MIPSGRYRKTPSFEESFGFFSCSRSADLSHVVAHFHQGDAPIRAFYGLRSPSFSGPDAQSGGKTCWIHSFFAGFTSEKWPVYLAVSGWQIGCPDEVLDVWRGDLMAGGALWPFKRGWWFYDEESSFL